MTTLLRWPRHLLNPQSGGRPNYAPRNMGGTPSLSGFTQVVSPDAGTWAVTYQDIPIRGWRHIQAWDTLVLRLEGRANPILVPVCEGSRQPWPGGVVSPHSSIPHSDDTLFSDDTGYDQLVIDAEIAEDAALRATTVRIGAINAGAIMPAHFFSVGERLYQIRSVEAQEVGGAVSGTDFTIVYTVRILPPLRAAVSAGDKAEFQRPVLKARLASDREMERTLQGNRLGTVTVNFIEDVS